MGSVTCSVDPGEDHVLGNCFQVVGLADERHGVDEHGGQVDGVEAELGRLVVPGEDVVVVVPAFAEGSDGHAFVLYCANEPKIIKINIKKNDILYIH